jgi:L-methionine (R)-S-oxide reductase
MHALPPRKFVPMTHSDFSDRAGTYAQLKHSIVELICDPDLISNQANFSAAISAATGWHWVGFYRVVGDELVLGPFQGPVACTRLRREQGVCSAAWRTAKTVLDIDSIEIDDFCAEDARELEALLNEVCDALLPSHS